MNYGIPRVSHISREDNHQLMFAYQDYERAAGEGLNEKERPNVSVLNW